MVSGVDLTSRVRVIVIYKRIESVITNQFGGTWVTPGFKQYLFLDV